MSYENYAKIRDLRCLTDYQVAKKCGFGNSTFSDWKSGRSNPKREKLEKIASALVVPVEALISGNPSSTELQTGFHGLTPNDSKITKIQHVHCIAEAWGLTQEDEDFLANILTNQSELDRVRQMYELMKRA